MKKKEEMSYGYIFILLEMCMKAADGSWWPQTFSVGHY